MRSYPDPEALQPQLEAFLRRMMDAAGPDGNVPSFSYKHLWIENEVVLVTEPEGLIPHALTVTRTVDVTIDLAGVEQIARDYRVASYAFTYRNR